MQGSTRGVRPKRSTQIQRDTGEIKRRIERNLRLRSCTTTSDVLLQRPELLPYCVALFPFASFLRKFKALRVRRLPGSSMITLFPTGLLQVQSSEGYHRCRKVWEEEVPALLDTLGGVLRREHRPAGEVLAGLPWGAQSVDLFGLCDALIDEGLDPKFVPGKFPALIMNIGEPGECSKISLFGNGKLVLQRGKKAATRESAVLSALDRQMNRINE